MNWKLVVGILLILGGLKAFFSKVNAYLAGDLPSYPLYAQLGSVTLILVGCYLIYKGKKKNQ